MGIDITMVHDDYLGREFQQAKKKALRFIERFNEKLPTQQCPNCRTEGHVPGLPCPEATCGYVHPVSWVLLLDTEFGYSVISISNRRHTVAVFNVDEDAVDNMIDDDEIDGDASSQ
jgi:hypothetical protein